LLFPFPVILLYLYFYGYLHHPHLHSFPTRRSSDLDKSEQSAPEQNGKHHPERGKSCGISKNLRSDHIAVQLLQGNDKDQKIKSLDRKSTRLNSSHVSISYAVFCLKKQNCSKFIGYQ